MKYKIIYTLLTVISLTGLRVLGITTSAFGSVIIAGSLILGTLLAGFQRNQAMLAFATAFLLMATRTIDTLTFYVCALIGGFCIWAWNKNQSPLLEKLEQFEENP